MRFFRPHPAQPVLRQLQQNLRGFSLVEMLVVMSIMVALFAVAAVSFSAILDATQLRRGGQMVMDSISLARQEAVRGNREIHVLFLKLPENGGQTKWRGMLLRSIEETREGPVERDLEAVELLPQGVVLTEDDALSPLLDADGTVSGTISLSAYPQPVEYSGFRIRPGGSLDKSVTPDTNFVTLVRTTDTGNPPVNYFTVQVNPVTGAVMSYRP